MISSFLYFIRQNDFFASRTACRNKSCRLLVCRPARFGTGQRGEDRLALFLDRMAYSKLHILLCQAKNFIKKIKNVLLTDIDVYAILVNMKLRDYLCLNRIRHTEFAKILGTSSATLSKWMAEGKEYSMTPNKRYQNIIYKETCGEVTPNDWILDD